MPKIINHGDSLVLTIPSNIVKQFSLKEGLMFDPSFEFTGEEIDKVLKLVYTFNLRGSGSLWKLMPGDGLPSYGVKSDERLGQV